VHHINILARGFSALVEAEALFHLPGAAQPHPESESATELGQGE
jgi:hypothetical protein